MLATSDNQQKLSQADSLTALQCQCAASEKPFTTLFDLKRIMYDTCNVTFLLSPCFDHLKGSKIIFDMKTRKEANLRVTFFIFLT